MNSSENIIVSVIVPCYNTAKFVGDTLRSVLEQPFTELELICINDGSTDDTEKVVRQFTDPRVKYISKKNTGVSDTRNVGFEMSKGKYILYLDADDILSPDFLTTRVNYLEQHSDIGFCCSEVIKIDEDGNENTETRWIGAHSSIMHEVLSYNLDIITCPSNYLFRKKTLEENAIRFDPQLSSSADRFFLIELSKVARCGLVEGGFLYYRMHSSSMSHKLTVNLLRDNSIFKKKILAIDYIPDDLKKEFRFKTNYILAGSYYKLRKLFPFLKYASRAFYHSPSGFIKQLIK